LQLKLRSIQEKIADKEQQIAQQHEQQRREREAAAQREYEQRVKENMKLLQARLNRLRRHSSPHVTSMSGAVGTGLSSSGVLTAPARRAATSIGLRRQSDSSVAASSVPAPLPAQNANRRTLRRVRTLDVGRQGSLDSTHENASDFSREIHQLYEEQRQRELANPAVLNEPRIATPSSLSPGSDSPSLDSVGRAPAIGDSLVEASTGPAVLSVTSVPAEVIDVNRTPPATPVSFAGVRRLRADAPVTLTSSREGMDVSLTNGVTTTDVTLAKISLQARNRQQNIDVAAGHSGVHVGERVADSAALEKRDSVTVTADHLFPRHGDDQSVQNSPLVNDKRSPRRASASPATLRKAREGGAGASIPLATASLDEYCSNGVSVRPRVMTFSQANQASGESQCSCALENDCVHRRPPSGLANDTAERVRLEGRMGPRTRSMSMFTEPLDVQLLRALEQHRAMLKAGRPSPRFMTVF